MGKKFLLCFKANLSSKQWRALALVSGLFLPFQNCSPTNPQALLDKEASTAQTGSSTAAGRSGTSGGAESNSQRSGSSSPYSPSNGIRVGTSEGASSSTGVRTGTSDSSTPIRNPGSTSGGATPPRTGTSTSPGASGGGATTTSGSLSVTLNANQLNVYENGRALIKATVKGGSGSYTYVWYKDGAVINPETAANKGIYVSDSQLEIYVGNYIELSNEGVYHLSVSDKTKTLRSPSVTVKILAPPKGCNSETYYTYYGRNSKTAIPESETTAKNFITGEEVHISSLFNPSSKANYLLPRSFNHLTSPPIEDENSELSTIYNQLSGVSPILYLVDIFNQTPQFAPVVFQKINLGAAVNGGKRTIACSFNLFLPNIYNASINPNVSWSDSRLQGCINPLGYGLGRCQTSFFNYNNDEPIYKLEGTMELQCTGGKYKIIQNSCKLVIEQPPDNSGGP